MNVRQLIGTTTAACHTIGNTGEKEIDPGGGGPLIPTGVFLDGDVPFIPTDLYYLMGVHARGGAAYHHPRLVYTVGKEGLSYHSGTIFFYPEGGPSTPYARVSFDEQIPELQSRPGTGYYLPVYENSRCTRYFHPIYVGSAARYFPPHARRPIPLSLTDEAIYWIEKEEENFAKGKLRTQGSVAYVSYEDMSSATSVTPKNLTTCAVSDWQDTSVPLVASDSGGFRRSTEEEMASGERSSLSSSSEESEDSRKEVSASDCDTSEESSSSSSTDGLDSNSSKERASDSSKDLETSESSQCEHPLPLALDSGTLETLSNSSISAGPMVDRNITVTRDLQSANSLLVASIPKVVEQHKKAMCSRHVTVVQVSAESSLAVGDSNTPPEDGELQSDKCTSEQFCVASLPQERLDNMEMPSSHVVEPVSLLEDANKARVSASHIGIPPSQHSEQIVDFSDEARGPSLSNAIGRPSSRSCLKKSLSMVTLQTEELDDHLSSKYKVTTHEIQGQPWSRRAGIRQEQELSLLKGIQFGQIPTIISEVPKASKMQEEALSQLGGIQFGQVPIIMSKVAQVEDPCARARRLEQMFDEFDSKILMQSKVGHQSIVPAKSFDEDLSDDNIWPSLLAPRKE